ncbi:MAG: tRNA dihydrouridine(20/20a) synthase DusA [Ideonella sp.]|nr:tRNA dihydrouridine(20/20a) synthase DusA [Ideonella sp.]MCC7457969.1 tRNA dihydrouridine(20/20a) synthase DusA [Nitrospira sp.]
MASDDTRPRERWRLCVAPMMDWTDRHCRTFHRLIAPRARLYTEMVTTGALLHGDVARHLDFGAHEHPLALQLGGSEPADLAHGARLGLQRGYDEINLNCGCPSPRVQRGAFGACLMAEPALVRDCVRAMRDAVPLPVTVKHRIGLDRVESYEFVRDFVGTVGEGGCEVFIVHARNAWLAGLSPKANREVPPLRHNVVVRLKRDFPRWTFVVNGGVADRAQVEHELARVDGVMIGRAAYHDPWRLREWETAAFGAQSADAPDRDEVEAAMVRYMHEQHAAAGTPWPSIARHMMGLRLGQPGARRWRQVWSDHRLRELPPVEVSRRARAALDGAVPDTAVASGAAAGVFQA